MSTITRAQLLKELIPGLDTLFGLEYNTYENQHTMIYEMETSERSFEEATNLSGFGAAPVKPEGTAIQYDTAQESYTQRYDHETIAMGFSLTEEAMEDNLYDSISKRYTRAMARSMAYTKQVKAAAVLNNGFSSYQTGDGVSLYNTAHPLVSGGTLANRPITAADLSEAAVENMEIQIAGWVDERGLLINQMPRKLVIPRQLKYVATRILMSDLRPGTADNDVNANKEQRTIPEGWCINNYLTDPNAWFVITDVPDGLTFYERIAYQTNMDGDFDTGNVRYKARERYSFGVTNPRGTWGSPGTS